VAKQKQCKAEGCTHVAEYHDGLCAECADGGLVVQVPGVRPVRWGNCFGVKMVQVLCQCGWGSLGMRESDVPDECPVCGYRLREEEEDE